MQHRYVKIIGTGKYLPQTCVTAEEVDARLGVKAGWTLKKTGVAKRYFAGEETAAQMGAKAAAAAILAAGISFRDIDCIVGASGTYQQPIPCNAALIQAEMGEGASGVPAFDVNTTCLSFVAAMDIVSYMIEAGRYRTALLVTSEIASVGLDWEHKESAALFGDGAVAVVLSRSERGGRSAIVHAAMETYGDGAPLSEIRGGGTKLHPRNFEATGKDFLFQMDGTGIFRMTSKLMPPFLDRLMREAGTGIGEMKLVIPHQASAMAVRLIMRKLGVGEHQLMDVSHHGGNMIAASIPMLLHEAIERQRIERGDRVLLLGTSAGLSLGGLILDY
ncbi:beta-ketoacyl-ACP synthase III [Paenibacillus sp. J5C_2022]|uniref:beta-ketoacyl-ACP synthase III n=1 Tax=Paenibacillus sp. J5C2022 TaxID=2977129 RepID=UPI0021CE6ECF|nr:beta-ketoacyl-ACP synthase III [Paenibacillus sp. J5C2022]MCU6709897.1 beta-ketoacyl-ACP synthase III [Paenibacillus sp. J5C2022]